jgi:CheY-like chemotaxis protein
MKSVKSLLGGEVKILAIDDNPDNLITLRALLLEAFPEVILYTALNGPEGIELARVHDPDVIILDILMPGMDGFEVCRRLKADVQLRDIPVVFLTALKESRENRSKAIDAGGEAFLPKPIDENELKVQIRAMVKIKTVNRLNRDEKEYLAKLVSERTKELEESQREMLRVLEDLKAENEARRITEKALIKSEAQLRELNATKDKMLSIIAHDLKSPFNSIMGFSDLVVELVRQENYDSVAEYAEFIQQSAH